MKRYARRIGAVLARGQSNEQQPSTGLADRGNGPIMIRGVLMPYCRQMIDQARAQTTLLDWI